MTNTWQDIHVGDYGSVGKLTITEDGTAVDVSGYTTLQFIFTAPSGIQATKTAAFDTDGTNGVLKYTIEDGLFSTAGVWRVRARVAATGVSLSSEEVIFLVSL
jgi:carbohydrate-selective porin OprB